MLPRNPADVNTQVWNPTPEQKKDPFDPAKNNPLRNAHVPDLFQDASTKNKGNAFGHGEHIVATGDLAGWVQLQRKQTRDYAVTGSNWLRQFFVPAPPTPSSMQMIQSDKCSNECLAFILAHKAITMLISPSLGSAASFAECSSAAFMEISPRCFKETDNAEEGDPRNRKFDNSILRGVTSPLSVEPECLHGSDTRAYSQDGPHGPLVTTESCETSDCPCKELQCHSFLVESGEMSSGHALSPYSLSCDACQGTCGFLLAEKKTMEDKQSRLGGRASFQDVHFTVTCTNGDDACYTQQWQWGPDYPDRPSSKEIRLKAEVGQEGDQHKCLTVVEPIVNGATLDVQPCFGAGQMIQINSRVYDNDKKHQHWRREGDKIILAKKGLDNKDYCLNLHYYAKDAGAVINVWECSSHSAQMWTNNGV